MAYEPNAWTQILAHDGPARAWEPDEIVGWHGSSRRPHRGSPIPAIGASRNDDQHRTKASANSGPGGLKSRWSASEPSWQGFRCSAVPGMVAWPARATVHRDFGQDADHPDGAGEPGLGHRRIQDELARLTNHVNTPPCPPYVRAFHGLGKRLYGQPQTASRHRPAVLVRELAALAGRLAPRAGLAEGR
jgi:hypothetical protein